jgi:hypothetical protein
MPDLRVKIYNNPILGEEFSDYGAAPGQRLRNHIRLKLSRFRIDLYQLPSAFRPFGELHGMLVHTTDIFVRNVPTTRERAAVGVVNDLCWLLSLATVSQVRPFSYTFDRKMWAQNTTGVTMRFRPAIETQDGAVVRRFIEGTWTNFRKLKRGRKLREVIDYIATAEIREQPLEVRLLLAIVTLENLKATYAHAQKIPFVAGHFRKPGKRPQPSKWPTYSFRELLYQMLAQEGMRVGLQRVIALRNQIVHFGLSTRPVQREAKYYEISQQVIREYLLRLLRYHGPYFRYDTQQTEIL